MSLLDTIRAAAGGAKARARSEREPDDHAETEEEDHAETEEDGAEEDDEAETEEEEAETEEDDKAEDDEKPAARSARAKERKRIKAILGAPEASANAQLACHLAFETGMPERAAKRTLAAGGHPRGVVADRMRGLGSPRLRSGASGGQPKDADGRLVEHAKRQKAQRQARRGRA